MARTVQNHALINVPIEAFEPHCRAKTSVIVLENSKPSKGHRILGCLCETYGEDKHGRPRFKLVDGKETSERDDEMSESADLIMSSTPSRNSKLLFGFNQADAITRGVLVASFWWRKPYMAALDKFAHKYDCDLVPVGELIETGELTVGPGTAARVRITTGRDRFRTLRSLISRTGELTRTPNTPFRRLSRTGCAAGGSFNHSTWSHRRGPARTSVCSEQSCPGKQM